MSKYKRSIWDDLAEVGKQLTDKIDEALNPHKKKAKRAPVPVPVPVRNDDKRRDPYHQ
ncbi:MAG: hypothetical protein NZ750_05630 [Anaerolineae bacterium]|nr:hypothetical protein [Anaerolineae bacterium]MDW8172929.1 hypothetical protein [Anaerolineae bacterium]